MKRFVLPLAAIVILAIAGIYFQRRVAPHARQVATWLPGGTILFEDMPDLRRTAERWPETALAQMINEREVQAFLERPLAALPRRAELDKRLAQLQRIDAAHFFLAVTEWAGAGAPKAIAGLSYTGNREDLEALVAELRKKAQAAWPNSKSDIEKYGAGEIETFTTPNFSAGLAYRGSWLFIATDTGLLKTTLDRFEGKRDPDNLADLPSFKSVLQHLPGGPDNIFFLRPALLADKLSSIALVLNPTADTHGSDALKQIDALGMALKLDGELMRDAAYVVRNEPGEETPLARDSLRLSTASTIIATSSRLRNLASVNLPDPKSDPSGILRLVDSYVKIFAGQGLGAEQVAQAFGPESGFVLDWPAGAVIPTPLVMVGVRDAAKARKFLDTLATLPLAAGVSFTHTDEGGIAFYSLPPAGIRMFPLQVTLGLAGKCVIGALNLDAVRQGAKRWDAPGGGLGETAGYKKAAELVAEPTMSFSYVDTKAIFERVYGLFRGVASMGFVPHLSDYVDIAKLPAPETISRHLSPMVASESVKDGGLLVESAGPVTTTQALLAVTVSAGAAAVPLIEARMWGQHVPGAGFPGIHRRLVPPAGNPFTSPWTSGSTVNSSAPASSPSWRSVTPSASPSGGTP